MSLQESALYGKYTTINGVWYFPITKVLLW